MAWARNFFCRCPNNSEPFRARLPAAANAVTHFPLLWHWLQRSATNPATYDLLLDIAWKLALVLGSALVVEWLVRRALRRPIALLDARIPNSARTTATPTLTQDEIASLPAEPAEAAVQTRQRRIKLVHAWQALMRVPFVLGRLVLELLPVVAFATVGNLLLGTEIGDMATSRLVILAIVNAYVLRRVIICLARTLVSSGQLSIFTVRGETAAYIEIWVRRIATVGVFGIAMANVLLLLGLYRPGYFALLRLVMLTVHLLVVVVILQCRRPIAQLIRADASDGMMATMRNRLAHFWHYIAIALVLGLWARLGSQHQERLFAAVPVCRRLHRGHPDRAPPVDRIAWHDRPRLPRAVRHRRALPGDRDPRQSLSADAAQDRFLSCDRDRLCGLAGGLGNRCAVLVLRRPNRRSPAFSRRHHRYRDLDRRGGLGSQQCTS